MGQSKEVAAGGKFSASDRFRRSGRLCRDGAGPGRESNPGGVDVGSRRGLGIQVTVTTGFEPATSSVSNRFRPVTH
jgi:hypothetical protein